MSKNTEKTEAMVPRLEDKDLKGALDATLMSTEGVVKRSAETASDVLAAQQVATVQARYIVAMRNPRDMDKVRTQLLKECQRPGFAAVARYAKPVAGTKIVGPSIRFAEAAVRALGNVTIDQMTVFEDDKVRRVKITVTDLESNVPYSRDLTISKTVERRFAKEGQTVISSRVNSSGQTVHLVEATDDELQNKEAALASKQIRNAVLRLLPGDIKDECMDMVDSVERSGITADPDAARKAVVVAFAGLGVDPVELKRVVGKPLEQMTEDEIIELRALYAAIRDGEATWLEYTLSKSVEAGENEDEKAKAGSTKLKEKLAARIKSRRKGKEPEPETEEETEEE